MKRGLIFVLVALQALSSSLWAYDFAGAAKRYSVPQELLEAISEVESRGNNLAVNRNRNGSVDLGHMQINSDWQKSGKIEWNKLTDPTYCTYVGAWILAQELERYDGNIWFAVAAYNTGKSFREWEKLAEDSAGEKRARALALAARGRIYSRAVYAAYLKRSKKKGEEPPQLQKLGNSKPVETATKPHESTAYVLNPFGTAY